VKITVKESRIDRGIDLVGLGSIGIICFCYSLFWSNFAEIHIALPFLDFPIFVGEILLFECVILLALKWWSAKTRLTYKHYLFLLYVGWVMFRAIYGYFEWGPLALRNAALFYYPFFAVIGYNFYRSSFFNQKTITILFIIFLITKIAMGINLVCYYLTPYFILAIVLILKMKERWVKYVALGALLFLFSYKDFLQGSRSFLVANFVILLFLFFSYVLGILKARGSIKILSLVLFFLASVFVFLKFAPADKVRSLTTPQRIIQQIQEYDQIAQTRRKWAILAPPISVKFYNPNYGSFIPSNLEKQKDSAHFLRNQIRIVYEEAKEKFGRSEVLKVSGETPGETVKNFSGKEPEFLIYNTIDVFQKEVMETIENQTLEVVQTCENFIATEKEESILKSKSQSYIQATMEKKRSIEKEIFSLGEENREEAALLSKELDHITNVAVVTLAKQEEIIKEAGLEFGITDELLNEQENSRSMGEGINGDRKVRERGLRTEYVNIVFRVLVWRDMVQEIIKERAWFGFSFGKPQRSASIENSAIAAGEWGRDGWIAPHNAFLHMIYRAGILGFLAILSIFIALFSMIRGFIRKKSFEGLLLSSILIYWLVLASFLVVLELPYQAITFWSLFGMTFAYFNRNSEDVARAYGDIVKTQNIMIRENND
jgi:hypothetical protein